MKKIIWILVMISCLLFLLSLPKYKIRVEANSPRTWTVDDDITNEKVDFHTIQEAINSNNVTENDIIFVYEGTYLENVVINKSVTLIGENRDSTVVDGGGIDSVVSITVNNVIVNGFTMKNSGMSPYDNGISVERSSGSVISRNRITNNNDGIGLHYSNNNVISNNIISSNNFDGIGLYSSSSNVISGNTLSYNYDGIGSYSSNYNVISSNILSNNYYGIYLTFYSYNSIIYHNNFDNINQVWSDLTSIWESNGEGNYWVDYAGQDLNEDGIGDSPYIINTRNRDNHPLTGRFSDFSITLSGETYNIAFICNSTISDFRFEIGRETGNKMVLLNVTGEDGTVGFCRIGLPVKLMDYPLIVLVDAEEIVPTLLNISNEEYVHLYFTYAHSSRTLTIISSKTLLLYNALLDEYVKLQNDFFDLNSTYSELLDDYNTLLGNYTQLQENYRALNSSYQEYLSAYSESAQNMRNLMYIFAAATAVFLATTVYLSKHTHTGVTPKTKGFDET